jgi:hypothetical protein
VLVGGETRWACHTRGVPAGGGTFERWEVLAEGPPGLEGRLAAWCREHLAGHTGVVNLETLGGTVIEVHLRFSSQFADFYGRGWLEAVVGLHRDGAWHHEGPRPRGVSLPLFSATDGLCHPDEGGLAALRARVLGVHLAFAEGWPLSAYLNPPGGFLVAIVNAEDAAQGEAVRAELPAVLRVAANCQPVEIACR